MDSPTWTESAVKLSGDIDDTNLEHLRRAVMDALQSSGHDAVVDLSEVGTLTSGAMVLLGQASAVLAAGGRRLTIICMRHPVARAVDFELVRQSVENCPTAAPGRHQQPGALCSEVLLRTVAGTKAW